MIIKIWPVGSGNSKSAETASVSNCLDYITDAEKVMVSPGESLPFPSFSHAGSITADVANISRTITYMSDEDKIESKYISGYLCHPEGAVAEFSLARSSTIQRAGIIREHERGAYAYHIVQSFPEDLEISDAEVHQCGLELANKLSKHQAVVCSHIHPKIAEDGVLHGRCKHNHILINAYVHPEKLEPGSKRVKYHDCKETYAQLQVWNDEIAISHGLPIIRNPDTKRSRSWYEANASRKGTSWKDQMRFDIENVRRSANNWEEFVAIMESDGYKIRDGAHICYTAPDGKSKARGDNLGREYTKDGLNLYWKIRNLGYRLLECPFADNESPKLYDIASGTSKVLNAAIPLGGMRVSGMEQQYYFLPIEHATHKLSVLETYFDHYGVYDICDENNRPVAAATGQEIIECMELMRDGRQRMEQEHYTAEERFRIMLKKKEEEEEKERYYMDVRFRNSRTRRPYRCPRFNDDGTRRSSLELILILAATVLFNEFGYWDAGRPEPGHENGPIFGPTDWKIQNIIDSIYVADNENIETPAQLDTRLQDAGARLSRTRSALNKTIKAKEKMDPLHTAVLDYYETKDIAEAIVNMEDGSEKERMKKQYADVLEKHNVSKAVLYRFNTLDDEKITEFQDRYEQIEKDIQMLQDRFERVKDEYRRLKKLSYTLELAQNERYCYGPDYGTDKANRKSIDELLKDQKVAPAKSQRKTEPELLL